MPTGSLCAERNAISSALAADLTLRREHIKLVAVLFVPVRRLATGTVTTPRWRMASPGPSTPNDSPWPASELYRSDSGRSGSLEPVPLVLSPRKDIHGVAETPCTPPGRSLFQQARIPPQSPSAPTPTLPSSHIAKSAHGPLPECLLAAGLALSGGLIYRREKDEGLLCIVVSLALYLALRKAEVKKSRSLPLPSAGVQSWSQNIHTPKSILTKPHLFRSPSAKKRRRDPNPRGPCGTCMEWLKKVAETNPSFRVVTFKSFSCRKVYVKMLI